MTPQSQNGAIILLDAKKSSYFCFFHTNLERRLNKQHKFLDAFRTDEPTRFAFFEHFGVSRERNTFCFTNYEWEAVIKRFKESEDEVWAFSRHWHEILVCATLSEKRIRLALGEALPEEIDPQMLFIRDYGASHGPLVAEGHEELWHWNGEALVQVPNCGSFWVS